MASQQLFGKSWNSPSSSTIKLYSSCTSSLLCNQYAFFSFHATPPKRRRFAASASSSSSSTPARNAKQARGRSVHLDCPSSRSKSSPMSGKPSLSFKSLFGKRSLWRRIFFASKKVRSIILLNVITLVYASSIPVVKEVEAIVDPASFTVVRFTLSALPFIPFVWRAQNDVHTRNAGIELGFWVSLGYLTQALGLLTSDAGRATFLSMLTVIVVPLLDGMLGAVVPARTWFGALMAVLGVAMLESSGSPPCVGDLLNFLSALFFGVHMLRTEHIARKTSKDKFLPLLGYEVCVVAVFSTLWYLVGGWSGGLQECNLSLWTWEKFWDWMIAFPWIPAIYTGIFSSGLCLWGEMAAMRDVSATETAIIYALEPVWGGGFAWFLLGERWGTAGWVGAALVLGGSLTVQIWGSSPDDYCEGENSCAKLEHVQLSNEEKVLSASPVVISSGPSTDISDLLK